MEWNTEEHHESQTPKQWCGAVEYEKSWKKSAPLNYLKQGTNPALLTNFRAWVGWGMWASSVKVLIWFCRRVAQCTCGAKRKDCKCTHDDQGVSAAHNPELIVPIVGLCKGNSQTVSFLDEFYKTWVAIFNPKGNNYPCGTFDWSKRSGFAGKLV